METTLLLFPGQILTPASKSCFLTRFSDELHDWGTTASWTEWDAMKDMRRLLRGKRLEEPLRPREMDGAWQLEPPNYI